MPGGRDRTAQHEFPSVHNLKVYAMNAQALIELQALEQRGPALVREACQKAIKCVETGITVPRHCAEIITGYIRRSGGVNRYGKAA